TTIAPGDSHVCVLAAGRVYCAGNNQYGQLGQGHDQAETAMVQVALLPPISKLVTRRNTSCALSEQGVLYCWGANDQGQANPYDGALTVSAPSSALMQGIVCGVSL
ncbi:MAG TPA: hypothetical protein ENK23_01955, partial [Sorangium sp.]|nr:hypothetical protein [Sorangium sp.]